jgi:hypothetical protein
MTDYLMGAEIVTADDGDLPSTGDQVEVLHHLLDQRLGLDGPQVMKVAGMTYPQRVDLLTRLVDEAQALAIEEHRTREWARLRRDF